MITLLGPQIKIRIVCWQPLTPEALVASDPDVYLVMDRGIEGLFDILSMAET